MKWIAFILAALVVVVCHFRASTKMASHTVERDTLTLVIRDTLRIVCPPPPQKVVFLTDTIYLRDTVMVREQHTYASEEFKITLSGFAPKLEFVEVYPKTVTTTITSTVRERNKRWGIGLQAGYGYPYGAYVGIGVSYDLIKW